LPETPGAEYAQRTEWNVRDADATVIFSVAPTLAGGSQQTAEFALRWGRTVPPLVARKGWGCCCRDAVWVLATHRVKTLMWPGRVNPEEPDVAGFCRQTLERVLLGMLQQGVCPLLVRDEWVVIGLFHVPPRHIQSVGVRSVRSGRSPVTERVAGIFSVFPSNRRCDSAWIYSTTWAGDIGCTGGPFKTPQIDSLAKSGTRFEYCYSTPLCGPSRCQTLTGRYAFRTGPINNNSHNAIQLDREIMIPTVLKKAGYVTHGQVGRQADSRARSPASAGEDARPDHRGQRHRAVRCDTATVNGRRISGVKGTLLEGGAGCRWWSTAGVTVE